MIKRKKKICKRCNTEQYIFSHGRCARCAALDRRESTISSQRKKDITRPKEWIYDSVRVNRIRSRKAEQNTTDRWLQKHWGFKTQIQLFHHLWDTRKLVCPFSGRDISKFKDDTQMRIICCAHILPKSLYPLYKLNRDNVVLVHPEFHTIVDMGTKESRDRYPYWQWDKWDNLKALKIKEYNLFKQKHLL